MSFLSPLRGFHVFKLKNAGTRLYHKLAYVEPSATPGNSDVYYTDESYFDVPSRGIPLGLSASGKNFSTPWVKSTVQKEISPLRNSLVRQLGASMESVGVHTGTGVSHIF